MGKHYTNEIITALIDSLAPSQRERREVFRKHAEINDTYWDDVEGKLYEKYGSMHLGITDTRVIGESGKNSDGALMMGSEAVLMMKQLDPRDNGIRKVKAVESGEPSVEITEAGNYLLDIVEIAKEISKTTQDILDKVGEIMKPPRMMKPGDIQTDAYTAPGTYTRVDTAGYKIAMDDMRNKAWTEGIEAAIKILKDANHDNSAYEVARRAVNDPRWKK